MDENTIKNYIQKLEEFEKTLSQDEDNVDENYLKEIESVLMNLSTDASEFVGESVSTNSTKAMLTPILNCNIKKLKDDAVIPTYSKDGDAGMDLTATEIINNTTSQVTYGTGIAVEIPQGYVGLVFPRSSIRKMELELSNSVGVIDSGYRGEIQATFNKTNGLNSVKYNVGDRICQIMILPYPKISFNVVNELSETERGDGGFGSTGK
jgi:dUTP pyrophosphatase